jgi:long-chain fatty acid transport protein
MNRIITCIGAVLLSFAFVSAAYAGAIDNRTNWSAEWVRTLNRNAATDFADIAMYNPAGTVKLHEGFTINGSLQYGMKEYTNKITPFCPDCDSDEPSLIPGIFGVYNNGKWSLFAAVSNVAGGGAVEYDTGNWRSVSAASFLGGLGTYVSSSIEGESHYLGYTLGGAYALNEMLSFSLSVRYVDAYKELKGTVDAGVDAALDLEQEDDGWGGIFGINISPNEQLNIGIRYETETELDLKNTIGDDTAEKLVGEGLLNGLGFVDGQTNSRNLPATLGLGVSYKITPKLRTEVNLTYYFNEDADWDGDENNADNGYDVGIAFEYMFTDKLTGSIGYMYTEYGMDNPANMLPENPELDVNTIGAGIAYAFNEQFITNVSVANSFYIDDSFSPGPGITVEYEKNILFFSAGIEYRF